MLRFVSLALFALFALCTAHATAHAFDTAPHRVGDSLDTAAAQALLASYEALHLRSMPLGATHDKPLLTADEAIDIAAYVNDDGTPRRQNPNRSRLYPDTALRPQGFAIPENFAGQPTEAYQRAKFGPFRNVNEHY